MNHYMYIISLPLNRLSDSPCIIEKIGLGQNGKNWENDEKEDNLELRVCWRLKLIEHWFEKPKILGFLRIESR